MVQGMTCIVQGGCCARASGGLNSAATTGSVCCNKANAEAVLAGGQVWATVPTINAVQDAAQQAPATCREHLAHGNVTHP